MCVYSFVWMDLVKLCALSILRATKLIEHMGQEVNHSGFSSTSQATHQSLALPNARGPVFLVARLHRNKYNTLHPLHDRRAAALKLCHLPQNQRLVRVVLVREGCRQNPARVAQTWRRS